MSSEGANNCWERVAPARVNLLGEHTDYTGGMVLPMAIPFYTHARIRRLEGEVSSIQSDLFASERKVLPGEPLQRVDTWSDYPAGVLEEFRKLGIDVPAFELSLEGNVPSGAGLSSSASVEVSTCMALLALTNQSMSAKEIALLCQRAENLFVRSPCGIMDQAVISTAQKGHALMLNTRDLSFELVPMNIDKMAGTSVVIINSEVKHSNAAGSYGERRREAEAGQLALATKFGIQDLGEATTAQVEQISHELDPVILKRVRHIVTENERVWEAREAMFAGDAKRMGEIMLRGHSSMRDDYEITCAEIDFLVDEAAQLPGCYGARMTGGGFGGCTVNLVENSRVESFSSALLQRYKDEVGICGAAYVCVAVDGAVAMASKERL